MSIINLKDLIFENNLSLISGGGFSIQKSSQITLNNIQSFGNTALQDSGFKIEYSNQINITESNIHGNNAQNSAGGGHIYQCRNILLQNMNFKNNTSQLDIAGLLIQLSNDTKII